MRWEPPSDNGSVPLAGYRISVFPQSSSDSDSVNSTYSDCTHGSNDNETQDDILTNSACVEVECELTSVMVSSGVTSANVSGLTPGLEHVVVITALSNGTNLQSNHSNAINFTTLTDGKKLQNTSTITIMVVMIIFCSTQNFTE